jgi:hypothetical protein
MRMRDWIVRVLQLLWLDLCLGAVGHNGELPQSSVQRANS